MTGGFGARFWRFYPASATSNLADGIGKTAIPLIAASYTRSPVLISGLITFAFLPWLFFALPAGAVVDRLDRRYSMAAANVVRAAASALLAVLVLTHTATIALVYLVTFLLGTAETVYDSASRAILPQLVPAPSLDRANGLLTVEETLGQTFVGGPVGSALFVVGAGVPLLVNASGFALAALVVITLGGRYRPVRAGEPMSVRRDVAVGIRWLGAHRFLRSLTAISGATALIQSMTTGVFVLYVLEQLRLPNGDFGYFLLAAGVGGLIGGLGTPILARHVRRGPLLTAGAVLSGAAIAAMAFTRNGFLGAILFALVAAGVMVWNVITMSLRQALIPEHLFGRVQGAYRTVVWGAIPVGSILGGLLADAIGLRPVFVLAGLGLVLCAGWLGRVVRVHRDLLVAGPAAEPVAAAP